MSKLVREIFFAAMMVVWFVACSVSYFTDGVDWKMDGLIGVAFAILDAVLDVKDRLTEKKEEEIEE